MNYSRSKRFSRVIYENEITRVRSRDCDICVCLSFTNFKIKYFRVLTDTEISSS